MDKIRKKRIINNITLLSIAVIVYLIFFLLIYLEIIDEYMIHIITLSGIYTIVALSLNLVTGYTGQLALGQAGFMAIGAYTTGVILLNFHLPIIIAIFLGGVISAIFGFIIGFPALRLRGDYLAITTLGFGEIIKVLINYFEKLTGGSAGLKGIPHLSENGDLLIDSILRFTWVFFLTIVFITLVKNLINSSPGRAIISIREDEIAASAMGINISYYKIIIFTLSAFIAGIGGGIYACYMGYINSEISGFLNSVNIVIIVVLGGLGSITGTVIAALFFVSTQEMFRIFNDWRLVLFGLLLIILMRFRPKGLMGSKELSFIRVRKRIKRLLKKGKGN